MIKTEELINPEPGFNGRHDGACSITITAARFSHEDDQPCSRSRLRIPGPEWRRFPRLKRCESLGIKQ